MARTFPTSRLLRNRVNLNRRHGALTLVEMLIGMAITLLMMAAVVNLFANIGAGVRIQQATIELSGELRDVRAQLFNDLTHATCRTLPWQRPDEDPGYLEIVEGGFTDRNPSPLTDGIAANGELNFAISQIPGSQDPNANDTTDATGLGDYDDIIALTVRQESAPFRARFIDPNSGSKTIESSVAEVIWFAVENDLSSLPPNEPGMRKIYRRELVVAPWVDLSHFNNTSALMPNGSTPFLIADSLQRFYDVCDVSVRIEEISPGSGTYIWVANTLGDLTKRENRYAHNYNFDVNLAKGFPHQFPYRLRNSLLTGVAGDPNTSLMPLGLNRAGEDLLLENVLAFDVLVYDPGAPLFQVPATGTIIEPVSGGVFNTSSTGVINANNLVGFGAYVDLGWDNDYDYDPNSFSGSPKPSFQEERLLNWHPNAPNDNRDTPAVYDTWSLHYEYDGLNQADYLGVGALVDEGTNGLDDDNRNGVDDIGFRTDDGSGNLVVFSGERETSPPYDVPLRGIQVKIRIYEPDTRQVREVSVTASYVPQ